jgi:hypothetical protein
MRASVTGPGFLIRLRFLAFAKVEQGGLRSSMFAQLGHLIDAALGGLLLFSLVSPFRFVPLPLLSGLLFLTLGKC